LAPGFARGTSLQSLTGCDSTPKGVGDSHEVDLPFRVDRALGNPLLKCRSGSGSFGISRSLLDLRPSPTGAFEVFPRSASPPDRNRKSPTLVSLASSSECSLHCQHRLSPMPPLMGFVIRPTTDVPVARQLAGASSQRPCGTTRLACSAYVVSHHLDGLLRASSRGFVAPRNRSGVRCVSHPPGANTLASEEARVRDTATALPATRFTPSEEFPSPTAVPHRCGRCLLVVTSPPVPDAGRDQLQ